MYKPLLYFIWLEQIFLSNLTQLPFHRIRFPFRPIFNSSVDRFFYYVTNLRTLFRHFQSHPFHSPIYYCNTHFLFLSLSSFSSKKLLPIAFMAEEDSTLESPHSIKYKIKSSLCFACCFSHHRVKPRIVRSSSLRTHNHNHNNSRSTDFPHLKEKCSNFFSRITHHRRRHSADFHYDALSYALNFEDDANDDKSVNDLTSFSARLPASPPSTVSRNSAKSAVVATVEIAARSWSKM
jgi:hypothetical protein